MPKRYDYALAIIVLAGLILPTSLFADKVTLKTGKVIQCKIRKETDEQIEIEVGGSRLTLPKSRIESIEREDAATNAIARGDDLFSRGEYEAAIRAYEQARDSKPEEVKSKIEAVRIAIRQAKENALSQMSPEEAERAIRLELSDPDIAPERVEDLKKQLADVLIKRAELMELKREYAQSARYLEEAWKLAPGKPGLIQARIDILKKRDRDASGIVGFLKPWLAEHPDDIETAELYVKEIWKTEPWEALKVVYPKNEISPKATPAMKELLPDILEACYKSGAFPMDAQLNREECRRHLLALKPDAVLEEIADDSAGGLFVSKPYLEVLLDRQKINGRENAMIHYLSAARLVTSDVPKAQRDLMRSTALEGWTPRSSALLPLIEKNQPAFDAIRRGAALNQARNMGWRQGLGVPVPDLLAVMNSAVLFCDEGLYFETQGKYGDALNNYLDLLTMGRDYGAPEAILVCGIYSWNIQALTLRQIPRIARSGKIDRTTLDGALKRIRTIEQTQSTSADFLQVEANMNGVTYRQIRTNPEQAREAMKEMGGGADSGFSMESVFPVDAIARSGARIEQDSTRLFQNMIQQLEIPYWQRDNEALKRRIKLDSESLHWVVQKQVVDHLNVDARFHVVLARLRLAQIAIALELYKADMGVYPEKLADLSPKYLPEVPLDPFSGQEFKYVSKTGSMALYSIGPDKTDDGGRKAYDSNQGVFNEGDIF